MDLLCPRAPGPFRTVRSVPDSSYGEMQDPLAPLTMPAWSSPTPRQHRPWSEYGAHRAAQRKLIRVVRVALDCVGRVGPSRWGAFEFREGILGRNESGSVQ